MACMKAVLCCSMCSAVQLLWELKPPAFLEYGWPVCIGYVHPFLGVQRYLGSHQKGFDLHSAQNVVVLPKELWLRCR